MNNSKLIFVSSLLLAFSLVSTSCTATAPTIQTGADAEVSFDGLHKVDHSTADDAWARPDIDLSTYGKIMLVDAGVEYTPTSNRGRTTMDRSRGGPYFIDDKTRARFEMLVDEIFDEEMAKTERFEIVEEAGPDVLTVSVGLLNVTSYVPADNLAGRSGMFIRSVGDATLVLELRDSETDTILARSIDRRAAERPGGDMMNSNSVTNASEVKRLIRTWAKGLREGLDGFGQQ